MSGEAWLYLLAVLVNAVNLFLQVFFTIMYSDLEWSVFLLSSRTWASDPSAMDVSLKKSIPLWISD